MNGLLVVVGYVCVLCVWCGVVVGVVVGRLCASEGVSE